MKVFHLTAGGAPQECRRTKECPYGGEELHFASAAEAKVFYKSLKSSIKGELRLSLKSLSIDGLRATLLAEAFHAGLNTSFIEDAMVFATELHEGQHRSGPTNEARPPYIGHPLRNAVRLLRWGSRDADQIVIALLHDVVEDCALRYAALTGIQVESEEEARTVLLEAIASRYNERIALAVNKLSNPIVSKETKSSRTVEEAHEAYVAHVTPAVAGDDDVLCNKLSDFHDNAAGLYHNDYPHRKQQTRKQASKYFKTLPALKHEVASGTIRNESVKAAADESLALIDARMRWLLGETAEDKK